MTQDKRPRGLVVAQDLDNPGCLWRVDWFDSDGAGYITIFAGQEAESRARDYHDAIRDGRLDSRHRGCATWRAVYEIGATGTTAPQASVNAHSLPPPTLAKRCHGGLARRLVAVRRRAILVRPLASIGYPNAGDFDRPAAGNHTLGVRGREPGAD